jgi:RNA-directed DNA polymerase
MGAKFMWWQSALDYAKHGWEGMVVAGVIGYVVAALKPISTVVKAVLLNELDRELERRGHRFMRYADDANIYVRSQRAGEWVMVSVERFLGQSLKLRLNREKSQVVRSWTSSYLGYGMSWHQQPRLRVANMSLQRLRDRLKDLLRGARGRKLPEVIRQLNPVLRDWLATSS